MQSVADSQADVKLASQESLIFRWIYDRLFHAAKATRAHTLAYRTACR